MADGNSPDGDQQQRQLARIRKEADQLPGGTEEHPAEPDIPPDRTRQFSHVNFSRMRTDWRPPDKIKMSEIGRLADDILATCFPDAYWLIERLYAVVREPVVLTTGEKMQDLAGHTRWKRNDLGFYIEDWSRLGDRERNDFLHELTIHMFEWRQQAAVMWGSAMFAKGIWEQAFAYGYTTAQLPGSGRLTVDDKTQAGHLEGMEDRYFAIFQSVLSRRADALIKSLERLEVLLLKDDQR
jgi:hypothetical protein